MRRARHNHRREVECDRPHSRGDGVTPVAAAGVLGAGAFVPPSRSPWIPPGSGLPTRTCVHIQADCARLCMENPRSNSPPPLGSPSNSRCSNSRDPHGGTTALHGMLHVLLRCLAWVWALAARLICCVRGAGQSSSPRSGEKLRVLVVGGSFGGCAVCRELAHDDRLELTLVEPKDYVSPRCGARRAK